MTEMLMTDEATTTTEGEAVSQVSEDTQSIAVDEGSTQQQSPDENSADDTGDGVLGAPEQYELKSDAESHVDGETLDHFKDVCRELNLSQKAAQTILEKMSPKFQEQQSQQIEHIKQQMAEATKADKEVGGDNLQKNLSVAKGALEKFGTPELRQLLEKTGLANNSEVIRLLYRVGKSTSSDSEFVSGKNSGGSNSVNGFENHANLLYPSQQS